MCRLAKKSCNRSSFPTLRGMGPVIAVAHVQYTRRRDSCPIWQRSHVRHVHASTHAGTQAGTETEHHGNAVSALETGVHTHTGTCTYMHTPARALDSHTFSEITPDSFEFSRLIISRRRQSYSFSGISPVQSEYPSCTLRSRSRAFSKNSSDSSSPSFLSDGQSHLRTRTAFRSAPHLEQAPRKHVHALTRPQQPALLLEYYAERMPMNASAPASVPAAAPAPASYLSRSKTVSMQVGALRASTRSSKCSAIPA